MSKNYRLWKKTGRGVIWVEKRWSRPFGILSCSSSQNHLGLIKRNKLFGIFKEAVNGNSKFQKLNDDKSILGRVSRLFANASKFKNLIAETEMVVIMRFKFQNIFYP
jgi:hypothetical protein